MEKIWPTTPLDTHSNMTKKQSTYLLKDWGANLLPEEYCEHVYISIKGVGAKIFSRCAYYECEGYTFIWTETESFCFDNKDVGDFIMIPYSKESMTYPISTV